MIYGTHEINTAILERAYARQERWVTHVPRELPPANTFNDYVWLGSTSHTLRDSKVRFIGQRDVMRVYGVPQSPTEIARDYLTVKYPKPRLITRANYDAITPDRTWPYLAVPGQYEDCCYVDLKAAYWSIVQIVGWDVEYWPGKFLGKASDVTDFPLPYHRLARNSLVSAAMNGSCRVWDYGRLYETRIWSPHRNVALVALVMDVLHALASIAESYGAVYIHTDGYILPRAKLPAFFDAVGQWGLPLRVKHRGRALVVGIGQYSIGSHHCEINRYYTARYARYIASTPRHWLEKRVGKFAQQQGLFYGRGDAFNTVDIPAWLAGGVLDDGFSYDKT